MRAEADAAERGDRAAAGSAARVFLRVTFHRQASGAMRFPPKRTVSSRDTGRDGGVTSATVPERHRELIPAAGLTGSTLSERGAHGRSHRGVPRTTLGPLANTSDLEVNAWCGGEGSGPPAPQSRWASRLLAATVGLRPGIAINTMDKRRARGAPGHGGQGHRTVFRQPSRGAAASRQRTGAASGAARGRSGTQQDQGPAKGAGLQGRDLQGNSKTGELQGLRFDARCIRAASSTVPKRFQRSAVRAAVQDPGCICHLGSPRFCV